MAGNSLRHTRHLINFHNRYGQGQGGTCLNEAAMCCFLRPFRRSQGSGDGSGFASVDPISEPHRSIRLEIPAGSNLRRRRPQAGALKEQSGRGPNQACLLPPCPHLTSVLSISYPLCVLPSSDASRVCELCLLLLACHSGDIGGWLLRFQKSNDSAHDSVAASQRQRPRTVLYLE